jgi:hypothetical protein
MTQLPVPAASRSYMTHRQALQDSCDLKLSRRQDSIQSPQEISRVRCINGTDVSRTISVIIIRDVIRDEMILETSVSFIHLTRLISREYFIQWLQDFPDTSQVSLNENNKKTAY